MYRNILVIDNFDSFTYNLVDYFRRMGCNVRVYRNTVEPSALEDENFDLLVLSPGPSIPANAGNMMRIIELFYTRKPILGVCLGHQALIEFFGGSLKFVEPVHGKSDKIINDGRSIYSGLPAEIEVGRYHSLAGDVIPNVFEVSARTGDGTVMSIRHKQLPIEGVQYHPESVLTMRGDAGFKLLENVVNGKLSTGNIEYFRIMRKMQVDSLLNAQDVADFVHLIADGHLTEDQKLVLLVSISTRLKNPMLLSRMVETLLDRSAWSPGFGADALDVCGTGGSELPRLNTSTLVAFTLAALGVKVAKHGNRAASGRFGSFDLLAALEIDPNTDPARIKKAYEQTGLAFLFAPKIHPAVGAFAGSRARLGIPTIFNILGPLLNPCKPERQFIGTTFESYMELMLETSVLLGKKKVMIARGEEGLDEVSVSGPTRVVAYDNLMKNTYHIHPGEFGIEAVPFERVRAESATQRIEIAQSIMRGQLDTEHYKLVAVNAAFIYANYVEPDMDWKEAYKLVYDTIASGKLEATRKQYIGALQD